MTKNIDSKENDYFKFSFAPLRLCGEKNNEMKARIKLLLGTSILLVIWISCSKEINNPFDPECPKEIWTPTEFKVVQADNSLNLTWKQGITHIGGFKIDRKVGSQEWSNIASPGKTAESWNDNNLTGGAIHQYRLYAYAGDNQSNAVTAQATPVFAATLTTSPETVLTCSSATLGGTILNMGGAPVTERGIVYAKTANPTTNDNKIAMGSGEGSFSQNVTGLDESTTYYVRAFATNSAGTSYGNQISFTTPSCASPANVSTNTPANVTCTSATMGGNVTNDGGATVTERGIVYAKTTDPLTSDTKIAMGSGTGTFSQVVTGLTANSTYYVKAYAINNAGTSYGDQKSFKTPSTATLTTSTATSITSTSAVLGGSITNDGGATITERGIVYAKTTGPTTSDTKIAMGSGTGSFSQTVSGLTCGSTYYVRAYAVNCAGTSYGNQISFPTGSCITTLNIIVKDSKLSSTAWSRGLTIGFSCTVSATGLMLATANPYFGLYISEDDIFSARTDHLIYEEKTSLSALNPSFNISSKISVPSTLAGGTYYILFIADSRNEYDESSKKDNVEAIKITMK
jgi:hypothetical protein